MEERARVQTHPWSKPALWREVHAKPTQQSLVSSTQQHTNGNETCQLSLSHTHTDQLQHYDCQLHATSHIAARWLVATQSPSSVAAQPVKPMHEASNRIVAVSIPHALSAASTAPTTKTHLGCAHGH